MFINLHFKKNYPHFKKIIFISKKKLIAIDLSKQHAFDADPKVIQQINFTGNLDQAGNIFYYLGFSQGLIRKLWILFHLALALGNCWGFCQRKPVFPLMCVSK